MTPRPRPRGGIDRAGMPTAYRGRIVRFGHLRAAQCGYCASYAPSADTHAAALAVAFVAGWRRSMAWGWLCVRCDQARHPL